VIVRVAIVVALAIATATASSASAAVLVVGDSLGVGTKGALRSALPDVAIDTDNRGGRPSAEGVAVLRDRLGPEHEVVVFDLGTNDGPSAVAATAASLAAARQLTGHRCLVVATLNHPPVGGVRVDGQNAMIRRFALDTPTAALVDWHDAAASTPGSLRSDGVHATASGYALRGLLFADAITSCLAGGLPGPGSNARPGAPASATRRPADARRLEPRPEPSLVQRALAAVAESLLSPGGPIETATKAAAAVGGAATLASTMLTPRGPEPVLGASN
jgi:lysophospholipase L1-like esterase